MNILDLIYIQLGINIILFISILYFSYLIWKYKNIIRTMNGILLDDPIPVDPRLIEEWKARRNSLPEGSDDWISYSRRLVQAGILREV